MFPPLGAQNKMLRAVT